MNFETLITNKPFINYQTNSKLINIRRKFSQKFLLI